MARNNRDMASKRRKERTAMGSLARSLLGGLGLPDPAAFQAGARLFERLYGERFLDQVVFVGLRHQSIHLRARDGAWKRRAQVLEAQILADFKEFTAATHLSRVIVSVGPLPDQGYNP